MNDSLLLTLMSQVSELGQQVGAVQAQNVIILNQQTAGDESRRRMHEKLDDARDGVNSIHARMGAVEKRLDDIDPVIKNLSSEHMERKAVRRFFNKNYALGAGAVGATAAGWHQWEKITAFVAKLFK